MRRVGIRIAAVIGLVLLLSTSSNPMAQGAAAPCGKDWIAKAVSVQGLVEAKRAGQTEWEVVRLNFSFCTGDVVRLADKSRACIVLPNEILLRLDQNTIVTFNGVDKEGPRSLVDLLKGIVHFFSRIPRGLTVTTPFVNGGGGRNRVPG
jgi:hypothetical protein